MIDLYDYEEKKIKIVCIEDEIIQGKATMIDTEYDTNRHYVRVRANDGMSYEIYADEIKSIEIIE